MGVGRVIDGSYSPVRSKHDKIGTLSRDIHGVERFPKNLIIGARSACAAEARRALVANILVEGIDRGMEREEAGRGLLVSRKVPVVFRYAACSSGSGPSRSSYLFVEEVDVK